MGKIWFLRGVLRLMMIMVPLIARAEPPTEQTNAGCRLRVAEKLGVRFVELCDPEGQTSLWISAAPMPCSEGQHETLECPKVVLLSRLPGMEPLISRNVAMVDAITAHRLCALRFAGRVATPAQRDRAAATLGLSAVAVTEKTGSATEFHIGPVPEWTSDGECVNPSLPGTDCRFTRQPEEVPLRAPIPRILDCDARSAGGGEHSPSMEVETTCPAPGWDWQAEGEPWRKLPCGFRLIASARKKDGSDVFEFHCRIPTGEPRRASAASAPPTAAFRCVVPEWSLTGMELPGSGPE